MNIFSKLTERQQQALQSGKADGSTRKALFRRGLITSEGNGGFETAELTDIGRLVLLEYAQRDNKPDKFKPGDQVVAINSYFVGQMPVINAERATVVEVLDSGMLSVKSLMWSRHEIRQPQRYAHVADALMAGVMELVR